MATFQELVDFRGSSGWDSLRNKVQVAVIVKAQAVSEEATPTSELKMWAREALESPQSKADIITYYVVADNSNLTIAQITGASDSAIQTAVDKAVNNLFGVA